MQGDLSTSKLMQNICSAAIILILTAFPIYGLAQNGSSETVGSFAPPSWQTVDDPELESKKDVLNLETEDGRQIVYELKPKGQGNRNWRKRHWVYVAEDVSKSAVRVRNSYLTREGDDANEFFLIRHGDVVIEAAMPGRSNRLIETLNEGHVVGWSWLFEPYRWHFDVRSITLVRALSLDASCLRARCEEDHTLGYMLMKKFSQVMMERLQATRVRALNVYS